MAAYDPTDSFGRLTDEALGMPLDQLLRLTAPADESPPAPPCRSSSAPRLVDENGDWIAPEGRHGVGFQTQALPCAVPAGRASVTLAAPVGRGGNQIGAMPAPPPWGNSRLSPPRRPGGRHPRLPVPTRIGRTLAQWAGPERVARLLSGLAAIVVAEATTLYYLL